MKFHGLRKDSLCLLLLAGIPGSCDLARAADAVRFEQGSLVIPTYTPGQPLDTAPLFEAGNAKGLYPYAAFDRETLSRKPEPRNYESLSLENEYLRVVILPELGGRIWSVWDKVSRKNVFYTDQVIKPSTYNQRGAWPVGNIEAYGPFDAHMLTWPGEPWPWATRELEGGGKSVVLSHIEHFFRNKLSVEVALYPGRAYVELTLRLHNRNQLPNRYLLWTNAGVPAREGTRFIYPMTRTIGHDTEEFGSWPVYRGVDLSWYRNNQVMLGVFGLDIYDDFISGYDYDSDYGTVCTTNRKIARGIKTWTWGVGQAGLRHLKSYTDSGIPYIEVQSGRFVWDGNYEFIAPGKTDGWTEYWYGMGGLGGLTTANRDVGVHLKKEGHEIVVSLAATSRHPQARLHWSFDGASESQQSLPLQVGKPVRVRLGVPSPQNRLLQLRVESEGLELLDYSYRLDGSPPPGEFAEDAIPREFGPSESLCLEELYQKGLTHEKLGRIEQAIQTYREALARDPFYTQANLQLGLISLSRFEDDQAIESLENVLHRDPSNGDAHYYLAVSYMRHGNSEQARRHLYRLLPSYGTFEQRDYLLGVLALREGDWRSAESLLQGAVSRLPAQLSIRQAYAYTLRKLAKSREARFQIEEILRVDPTDAFAVAESAFREDWSAASSARLERATARHPQGFLELATEYMNLGAWEEVYRVVGQGLKLAEADHAKPYPLLPYYSAYALLQSEAPQSSGAPGWNRAEEARRILREVSGSEIQIGLFPFRYETAKVLESALEVNPQDANAALLLGDLVYSRQQKDSGVELWKRAAASAPEYFGPARNLGWALVEKGDLETGLHYLDRSAALRPSDLEISQAVSQLYIRLGRTDKALEVAQNALKERPQNDQLLQLMASVQACSGNYDEALRILSTHTFGPRHQSYSLLSLYQGVQLLKALSLTEQGASDQAAAVLRSTLQTPANLGVDDFATLESSRLLFFEALTRQLISDSEGVLRSWQAAASTTDQDYNGEGLFRAIALRKIGRVEEADAWLSRFEEVNKVRLKDSSSRVRLEAHYLSAISWIFRGDRAQARTELEKARDIDASDLFVRHALAALQAGLFAPITG